ncbi:MAG: hypothetical protein NVSMB26_19420 [Beijerinckiaceae bacterium]
MPRYFFNVENHPDQPDATGLELPDIDAAKSEAIHAIGTLLIDSKAHLWNDGRWIMRVKDEAGRDVLNLQFLAVEPKPI